MWYRTIMKCNETTHNFHDRPPPTAHGTPIANKSEINFAHRTGEYTVILYWFWDIAYFSYTQILRILITNYQYSTSSLSMKLKPQPSSSLELEIYSRSRAFISPSYDIDKCNCFCSCCSICFSFSKKWGSIYNYKYSLYVLTFDCDSPYCDWVWDHFLF